MRVLRFGFIPLLLVALASACKGKVILACEGGGKSCANDAVCCSGTCQAGQCTACAAEGEACGAVGCCQGLECSGGTCGGGSSSCGDTGDSCSSDADCCATICVNGSCGVGAPICDAYLFAAVSCCQKAPQTDQAPCAESVHQAATSIAQIVAQQDIDCPETQMQCPY